MVTTRATGDGRDLPPHAQVHESADEYVVELDVADFTERELTIELIGPHVAVRGCQAGTEDGALAFRLHERLEESFRLPDDADPARTRAFYRHGTLEIRTPRRRLQPRRLQIEHDAWRLDPDAEPC
jgi:HSP20 family molecular chaperone IbpA